MYYYSMAPVFKMVAEQTGFIFDEQRGVLSGFANGYHISVFASQNSVACIQASVRRNGVLPEKAYAKSLSKMVKGARAGFVKNNKIMINVLGWTNKSLAKRVIDGIGIITAQLRADGFIDVCEYCGSPVPDITVVGSGYSYSHLCTSCATNAAQVETQQILAAESVDENVPMGILGALIGCIVGALVIYLIGALGYVAALGGIALAVASLWGYEKLGKKLTIKGIIITTILMIITVFLTKQVEWSIEFYKMLNEEYGNISFVTVFMEILPFLKETGYLKDFLGDLGLLYLFTALGAVPRIWNSLKQREYINDVVNKSGTAA